MGWLWDTQAEKADPVQNLDPSLKDFLEKESANVSTNSPYTATQRSSPPPPSTQSSSDAAPNTWRAIAGWTSKPPEAVDTNSAPTSDHSTVPPESQFPDGRYAHIWKSYRPLAEVEAATRSDADKMSDLTALYKSRKAAIQRAALENCVIEQMNERDCWENGSWAERMNSCRGPNRNFLRCYQMQARFLNALGYLSEVRSENEEERIQMHADKLYHEMIDRERREQEAKQKGETVPAMPPLIDPVKTQEALGEDSAWARARESAAKMGMTGQLSDYLPSKQKEIIQSVEGLEGQQRELELQLIAAESRARLEYSRRIGQIMQEQETARQERKERGKETFGDTLKRWWHGY